MRILILGEMIPCNTLNRYESTWRHRTDYNFYVECDENAIVMYVSRDSGLL